MDVDIDFVSEPVAPADAWAENQVTGHAPEELDLNALVDQFLRNGGKIQEVAQGATAQGLNGAASFNTSFFSTANVPEEKTKKRAEIQRNVHAKMNERHYAGDAKLVERLGSLLDRQPPRREILETIGMSDDRMQRLLRTYFKDDRRADPYRKQTHETRHSLDNPRDASLCETVRSHLQKGYTLTQTSQLTGLSAPTIRRIVSKYKLEVKARRKSVVQEPAGQ